MWNWIISHQKFLLLLLFFAILPLTFSSYVVFFFQQNSEWLFKTEATTIIAFYLLSIATMALALTPSTFIAIVSGYYFGWIGLLGIVLSYPLSAIFGLMLGKVLNEKFVGRLLSDEKKMQAYIDSLRKNEFLMIIFARLSPVLPFAMSNVALSSMRLDYGIFMLATLIGMLPRTFIFFWMGMNASEIWELIQKPSMEGLMNLIPVVLILVSTVGLYYVFKRSVNEARKVTK